MTDNQIKYYQAYTDRAIRGAELEERKRSNRANEEISRGNLSETSRHNLATEELTSRYNDVSNQLKSRELDIREAQNMFERGARSEEIQQKWNQIENESRKISNDYTVGLINAQANAYRADIAAKEYDLDEAMLPYKQALSTAQTANNYLGGAGTMMRGAGGLITSISSAKKSKAETNILKAKYPWVAKQAQADYEATVTNTRKSSAEADVKQKERDTYNIRTTSGIVFGNKGIVGSLGNDIKSVVFGLLN